jgi:UDP-4-amino-4,6-dideoxy-N-acetyl-beta-L-altrosamine transaminase
MRQIPYGRQDITEEDITAVGAVLRSDWLTQGPAVPAFENAVSKHCGAQHAVAVNSGTSALHVACLALGVGPGDWVWTSAITFVASANCALYCGARVDLVDIDPRTYNLSVESLTRKLDHAEKTGTLPKVVIPVHLCGQPCDMAHIRALSKRYRFKIIEDASHAIGARYRDEPVGNGRYSDIAVLSFHPVKIITTAEGGMTLTNDAGLAKRMQVLRTHGITRDPKDMTRSPDGPWYYEQIELGLNYRMTDVQAALGSSQIGRLQEFVAMRNRIALRYDELLEGLPLVTPWQHADGYSARHLYVVRLKRDAIKKSHRQVFEELRAAGVGVNLHYIPVYRQPFYERMGFKRADFPEAERYYGEAMTLPLYPGLTEADQQYVIDKLRDALGGR